MIHKKGKDQNARMAYRPLSILNADYKILVTALANRLSSMADLCISKHQTGFIRNRYLKTNIRRAMNIISKARTEKEPRVMLFLDAEKVFNSVEWPYLHIGLGTQFQNWLQVFYKEQTSIIRIDGVSSEYYIGAWGTPRMPLIPSVICLSHRAIGNCYSKG